MLDVLFLVDKEISHGKFSLIITYYFYFVFE